MIERSGAFLRVTDDKFNGELPHHFVRVHARARARVRARRSAARAQVNVTPTFLALSGETQTGPNTFWTKAALQYARNSGDEEWLRRYLPTLRNASEFCFGLIDPVEAMLNAPGCACVCERERVCECV